MAILGLLGTATDIIRDKRILEARKKRIKESKRRPYINELEITERKLEHAQQDKDREKIKQLKERIRAIERMVAKYKKGAKNA